MALKYRADIEDSLRRTENLLERAKSATNLRDQISRAYYACFHVMIAAIFLEKWFDRKQTKRSSHEYVRLEYASVYSATKKNQIFKRKNLPAEIEKWKILRESADYEIFTLDFENLKERVTQNEFRLMIDFVEKHIAHIQGKLGRAPTSQ